ncbi:helix-turn-helix DNA binding domain protein [Streptomyces phage Endor1]|uniref:Helix-turn-helix DNA binding domain protein n=1 Tax=Streptomyces phage Endor1 TaxID=2740181 RepID=A0A7G4AWY9_9CAUD|nr:sigma factor [Streptomyces phage Endor1]QMP84529.1 helix-turn-helix DNA binding domain protein [Streptomyces phage Endor1]
MAGAYDRALVERLLPAHFDPTSAYGVKNETAPDADMPKVKANPKHANTLFAHLADMNAAWRWAVAGGLSLEEARATFMRYGLDWTLEFIAHEEGCHKSTVQRRCEKAVGKIAAYLNQDRYVDGYDKEEAA